MGHMYIKALAAQQGYKTLTVACCVVCVLIKRDTKLR